MKTILVGEDNPANLQLMRELLDTLGYAVVEAVDGEEVLQKVATAQPDLLLLDIQMPKLDGYAVLKRLRQDSRYDGLRVVALTAYAMRGDAAKGLAAGFDDYITKPINLADLRTKLGTLLAERSKADG